MASAGSHILTASSHWTCFVPHRRHSRPEY